MEYKGKRSHVSIPPRATLLGVATKSRALPQAPELTILARLDDERERRGLSQVALGARVGLSQPQLSKMLRGEKAVTVTELARLCDALGLRLSDLMRQAGL